MGRGSAGHGVGVPREVGRPAATGGGYAGVPHPGPPGRCAPLRHSTASLLLSAGVPAEQAAKIMGHASLAVFYSTYADLLRPAAQDAAKRLARYLEAQEKVAAGRTGCV